MQINAEVIKVDVENKGKYRVANVAYKNPDGAVEGKKVLSFGPSKDVFKIVSEAQPGDKFVIESRKIPGKYGQEFWNWVGCVASGTSVTDEVTANRSGINNSGQTNAPAVRGSTSSPRSTYETPEERARKQVYIVRQSSISNAIEFLTGTGKQRSVVNVSDVLELAKQFEDYVFNGIELEEVEVV